MSLEIRDLLLCINEVITGFEEVRNKGDNRDQTSQGKKTLSLYEYYY